MLIASSHDSINDAHITTKSPQFIWCRTLPGDRRPSDRLSRRAVLSGAV